ncbi:NADPH-dependent FMN reductase [Pseudoalteromonas sp. P1-9]|uniref:NAD(P)H-dependent oxidoreductase n=1 Tax=Pseudoalteromonas sp. P1-9 TaxID=1710354 RepID=UPI0006D61EF8|nr:NAD(P)H-dependent oxidoreductase [Pseudoalteromonas sp. P1-9]KPV97087.1 NADPH-dependent FMN reductase [Pseudoalteromonas sp. P1-9]
MKIVIVSRSGRPHSNSLQLATKISEHFARLDIEFNLVDLSEMTQLLHHYETHNDGVLNKQKALLLEKLYSSDGIVIVAPEWDGMLPPVLHNFFTAQCLWLCIWLSARS